MISSDEGPVVTNINDVPGTINPNQVIWNTELSKFYGKWYPSNTVVEMKGFTNLLDIFIDKVVPQNVVLPWG